MSTSPLKSAIERIKIVRNSFVARFDADSKSQSVKNKALVHDYDRVIYAAAVITREANSWMIGITVDSLALRKILRADAKEFCDLLKKGLEVIA